MKSNLLRLELNYFLFFIICLYEYNNSKELLIRNINEDNTHSLIYSSKNPFSNNLNEYNYKEDDLVPEIIYKTIEKGKVQTEFLNYSNIYQFNFSDIDNTDDILINFYSLDCQIIIVANEEDIEIKQISNYEYDVFSAIIPNDKINSSFFKIKPLINLLEEKNKKRTYHLIINCLDKNDPQLILNEKYPSFIYFNENLENITFSYELNNSEEPVVFSFFIKERAKFEVHILDSEIPNRIIAYKDNIIIDPDKVHVEDNNINISVKKIDNRNCTMIIKVSGNNSPFYLQKNILNLGFMPINSFYHYYYMEIFKGEEGEIMIHNKIHNGYLLYQIIDKNNTDEKQILKNYDIYFPKYNSNEYSLYNKYNNISKNLNFYSTETEDCENGCYLLITYYSPKINMKYLDGIEYTLLARIWDEDEFKSQIVNIPLNEYVFGAIEPSFSSNNVHYYSVFIPEDNDIIFEFKGRNIFTLAKKGIIQINVMKISSNSFILTDLKNVREIDDEKFIIEINKNKLKLDSFENVYLSFAFTLIFGNDLMSYYYFRIIQKTSKNNYLIYPLDTNKVNLCKTSDNEHVCYFLLKNDYKELYNNFSIYAYGLEEANYYNAWPINETDYYSIDIDYIKEKYKNKTITRDKGGFFTLFFNENLKYVLLEIYSKQTEILEVLFNFDGNLIPSPSVDIYSYQSFYLKNNIKKDFYFDYALENKYIAIINNTSGEGYICFNQKCDYNDKKIYFSEKIILSFTISEEIKSIHCFTEKYLYFYIKIKDRIPNDVMEEVLYGSSYKNFSKIYYSNKAYYIKDLYKKGMDINFFFDFSNINNDNKEMLIVGFISNYDDIKYIDNSDSLNSLITEYLYNKNYIEGTYDHLTKSGLISFNNILSEEESIKKDIYYIFTFVIFNDKILEFPVEIFIDTKNESQFILQKNKYIRGSFNLLNEETIQSKTMYIQFEKEEKNDILKNTYIIEFSSNYQIIKPIFNNDFNYYDIKDIGGIQYYYFSTENLTEGQKYNFTIQINNSINSINNDLLEYLLPNYIIKYYPKENDYNLDFIIDKSIEYENIIDLSNNNIIYNVTIKNNQEKYNLKNDSNYTYFIRVCSKNPLYEIQMLKTTAFLFYINFNISIYETNDPNEDIEFSFSDSLYNKKYVILLFIKVNNKNGKNNEEMYYSTYFEIEKKEENENNKTIIILSIIFGSVFIISLVISIIVCSIYRKKNKNLKEQIQAISFSRGIDEENVAKKKRKLSKEEEDYESTFI